MARVTTAIVGCGVRTMSFHGPHTKRSEKYELVAVCDVDPERRAYASEKLGVPAVSDYRELLALDHVQSIMVVTTAQWHAQIALDATRASKHVLVEKPLADSARSAYAMAEAAERAGVVGITYYPSAFGWYGQTMRRLVREIEPMQGLFTAQRGPLNPQFFVPDHFGGIADQATHSINLALMVMGGEPKRVFAHVARGTINDDETIDRIDLVIELDGGRSINVNASMLGMQARTFTQITGLRGVVTAGDRETIRIVRHPVIKGPGRTVPADRYAERRRSAEARGGLGPLADLTLGRPIEVATEEVAPPADGGDQGGLSDHFADLITGAAKELRGPSLRDGARVVAVTEAMVESARTGRRVEVFRPALVPA
ncbi:MAG: Gfo/Idh/MocA family oxidoreductase [Chloroflexi bacterium]|nr:Gfo/Idh/MocA family oxidoreductase [Chloroflexota bacterium]